MGLIDKLIHKVTVKRRLQATINAYGESTYTTSTIYSSIPVRVETYRPQVDYNERGQIPKREIIIYFDKNKTIEPQDIIEAIDVPGYAVNAQIGRIREIVQAIRGTSKIIDHIEALIDDEAIT